MALQGNLNDLPLIDLVQILTLQDKTGILSISREFSQAQICFTRSRICAAYVHHTGRTRPPLHLQGEAALYDLLGWPEGQFNLELTPNLPLSNVDLSWDYIILEHCRRQDEHERQERLEKMSQICPRVLPNPPVQAQITLELEDWQILLQVNGQLTLQMIAANIRQELDHVINIAEKLAKQGLLELKSSQPALARTGLGVAPLRDSWQPPPPPPPRSITEIDQNPNSGWVRTTQHYPNSYLPETQYDNKIVKIVVDEPKAPRPQVQRGLLSGIMAKIRGL